MKDIVFAVPDFFQQMYGYREYLKQSVLRDLRVKYKRSFLGYIWTMLHPLAMMSVLAVVFSHLMRVPMKDYAIFVFSGLLAWNYFQSSVLMSLGSIRANARLFSQVPVPKYIFILSINFSNLINLLLAFFPLLLIMIVTGFPIHWTVLFFPIALIPLFFFTVGISLIVAASNVFFDDTLHLTEVGMSMLYFMTPVLYSRDYLPAWLIDWLVLNPLFSLVEGIREIFYSGALPALLPFTISFLTSLLFLLCALVLFRRVEDKFLYFI